MRGTLTVEHVLHMVEGIIPAYAGNTCHERFASFATRDHPRICGEHCLVHFVPPWLMGSSPHMRGTHESLRRVLDVHGIIPAYAGNTSSTRLAVSPCRDHPRICGEHSLVNVVHWLTWGSSPHMRGTHRFLVFGESVCGIIPAYAGNTMPPTVRRYGMGDHPRICGEHELIKNLTSYYAGSSPHMRGTHVC